MYFVTLKKAIEQLRWGLDVPTAFDILQFWRLQTPNRYSVIILTEKMHFLAPKRVVWAIVR